MLDADEYLHLAINASQTGDHHAALEHLHKALAKSPSHVGARYFLAAEHAELGLYERAFEEMQELLQVAPEVEVARFQLGLLSLQLERKENARQAFAVLVDGAKDMSLRAFSGAYLHLLEDRQAEAIEQMQEGLEVCGNPALRADMSRVLAGLSSASDAAAETKAEDGTQSVYLGAYRSSDEIP